MTQTSGDTSNADSLTHRFPFFRYDLKTEAVQEGGNRFVEVTDLQGETNYRFFEVEYAVACGMDGNRDLEALVSWAAAELDLKTTTKELGAIVAKLSEFGYLEQGAMSSAALASQSSVSPKEAVATPEDSAVPEAIATSEISDAISIPITDDDEDFDLSHTEEDSTERTSVPGISVPLGSAGSGPSASPESTLGESSSAGDVELGQAGSTASARPNLGENADSSLELGAAGNVDVADNEQESAAQEGSAQEDVEAASTAFGGAADFVDDEPTQEQATVMASPEKLLRLASSHEGTDAQSDASVAGDAFGDVGDLSDDDADHEAKTVMASVSSAAFGESTTSLVGNSNALPSSDTVLSPSTNIAANIASGMAAADGDSDSVSGEGEDSDSKASSSEPASDSLTSKTSSDDSAAKSSAPMVLPEAPAAAAAAASDEATPAPQAGPRPSAPILSWLFLLAVAIAGASYYYWEFVAEKPSVVTPAAAVSAYKASLPPKVADAPTGTFSVREAPRADVVIDHDGIIAWLVAPNSKVKEGDQILRLAGYDRAEKAIARHQAALNAYQAKLKVAQKRGGNKVKLAAANVARKKSDLDAQVAKRDQFVVHAAIAGQVESLVALDAHLKSGALVANITGEASAKVKFSLPVGATAAVGEKMEIVSKDDSELRATCTVSFSKGRRINLACPVDSGLGDRMLVELVLP